MRRRVLERSSLESVERVEREEREERCSVPPGPFPTTMVRLRLSDAERDEVLDLESLSEERCRVSRSVLYVRLGSWRSGYDLPSEDRDESPMRA